MTFSEFLKKLYNQQEISFKKAFSLLHGVKRQELKTSIKCSHCTEPFPLNPIAIPERKFLSPVHFYMTNPGEKNLTGSVTASCFQEKT